MAGGLSGAQATDELLARWATSIDDPDEGPDFWIGLAVTQAKVGRLESRVRQRALDIIESGEDLGRFSDADRPRRQRTIDKARNLLMGPQRSPVRLSPRAKSVCPFGVGDVLAYSTSDGRQVLLVVRGTSSDRGGEYALVVALEWRNPRRLPSQRRLAKLAVMANPVSSASQHWGFLVPCVEQVDYQAAATRVRVVGSLPKDSTILNSQTAGWVGPWSRLDQWFLDGRPRFPQADRP